MGVNERNVNRRKWKQEELKEEKEEKKQKNTNRGD